MNILKQRYTIKTIYWICPCSSISAIIRWGLIAVKVIELLIDAIVKFFGGDGFEVIDYSSFINNTAESAGGLADSADDVADGFGSAPTSRLRNSKRLFLWID